LWAGVCRRTPRQRSDIGLSPNTTFFANNPIFSGIIGPLVRLIYMSKAAPCPDPVCTTNVPLPTPEQLPGDSETLRHMVIELLTTLRRERLDKDQLQHRVDLLLRRLYGPRTERFNPDQLLLFDEPADGQDTPPPADSAASSSTAKSSGSRRKAKPHGRRPLPEDLPRRPQHHTLTDAELLCSCGHTRMEIGADMSEQLDWQPACYFVWQHWIHKYLCPYCATPKTTVADTPESSAATNAEAAPTMETAARPEATPETTAAAEAGATATAATVNTDGSSATTATTIDTAAATTATSATVGTEAATTAEAVANTEKIATATAATATMPTAAAAAMKVASIPPTETLRIVPGPPGPVIISAVKPAMPIHKGLPGPGLLAHVIVSKYCDHLPLYRQTKISTRQGVVLPRSTTCDWMAACAELLRPLYDLMVANVLLSRWLHTDDTTVKNLGHEPGSTDKAHLWLYWGDRDHPHNVFDFTVNRKRDGPQRFLKNYRGYLHADAFSGYDGLYLPGPGDGSAAIIEVACNAHARRKFYDAKDSDALRAHRALAYYSQLYTLERGAKNNNFDDAQRRQMRQELAVPILEMFHTWLEQEQPLVLPKNPLSEAIGYALNNWTALCRYTEAGFLSIDNNLAEREMKQIATGRKNWYFVGSENGGRTAAVLYSFTSTCERLQMDPWAYLQDVLTRLPATPPDQLPALLPDRWKTARQEAAAAAAEGSDPVPE
jgi:transposase